MLLPFLAQSLTLPATESVWVYSHASSPASDEFLRIWGAGGKAVPAQPEDGEEFSFGYLKIDVAGAPSGKPTKAILVLHNIAPAAFGPDRLKSNPLEARALNGSFSAATWTYGSVLPGLDKTVFGKSTLVGSIDSKDSIELDIDLLKGPNDFAAELSKAEESPSHGLFLALTSTLEPGGQGGAVYKVYSATAPDKSLRPELKLEY